LATDCHLSQLRQLEVQGEVAIEGVESKYQFVSVAVGADPTVPEELGGTVLARNARHLAVCRIDHSEPDELAALEAAPRRNRLG
jgi:hypothetical protein